MSSTMRATVAIAARAASITKRNALAHFDLPHVAFDTYFQQRIR